MQVKPSEGFDQNRYKLVFQSFVICSFRPFLLNIWYLRKAKEEIRKGKKELIQSIASLCKLQLKSEHNLSSTFSVLPLFFTAFRYLILFRDSGFSYFLL